MPLALLTNMLLLMRENIWCHPSLGFSLVYYPVLGPLKEPKQALIPILRLHHSPPYYPERGTTAPPYKEQRKTPKSLLFPKGWVDLLNKYSKVRTYQHPPQLRKTVNLTQRRYLFSLKSTGSKCASISEAEHWADWAHKHKPLHTQWQNLDLCLHTCTYLHWLLKHCSNNKKRGFDKTWIKIGLELKEILRSVALKGSGWLRFYSGWLEKQHSTSTAKIVPLHSQEE